VVVVVVVTQVAAVVLRVVVVVVLRVVVVVVLRVVVVVVVLWVVVVVVVVVRLVGHPRTRVCFSLSLCLGFSSPPQFLSVYSTLCRPPL